MPGPPKLGPDGFLATPQALSPANHRALHRCQAGVYWLVLNIVNDTVQFRFIAHAMVKAFTCQEPPSPAPSPRFDYAACAVKRRRPTA